MKKIVLTGGGTAGHVTPALALIPKLQELGYIIHYIGGSGIEKEIIQKANSVTYHEITTVKLRRSLTLKNLAIPFKLLKGISQSKKLLKQIKPGIVFSKGGFVAVPVGFAAHKLSIPLISHESDLTVGLANKLLLKKSQVMCTSFEITAQNLENAFFTGTPIRKQLFNGKREIAMKMARFEDSNKPCVLVMGGSLGAIAINKAVLDALPELTETYNVVHIVGRGNLADIKNNSYFQIEFTHEIEHFLALSTIVVSRAGSNSINEFLALQKPMLLIPLPLDASRGDQILNAKEFEKQGYAMVLPQENVTKETLLGNINTLYKKRNSYIIKMSKPRQDATNTILQLIQKYDKSNK